MITTRYPGGIPDELREAVTTAFLANGMTRDDASRLTDLAVNAAQRGWDSLETAICVAELRDQLQVRQTSWAVLTSYLAAQLNLLEGTLRKRGICSEPIEVKVSDHG